MLRKDGNTAPKDNPPGPSKRRVVEILTVVVLLVAAGVVVKVVIGPGPKPPEIITPTSVTAPKRAVPDEAALEARAQACLSGTRLTARQITKVGSLVSTYRKFTVSDSRTYDLRGTTITGYPTVNRYPLAIGKTKAGKGTCVIGGRVVGQQSRATSWQTMKAKLDGDGLNFKGNGAVIDGIRIDNVEDGIGTIGGDPEGILIRNAHMSYIRDDCIENDAVVGLVIKDSLLDGCFFGLSQRPGARANAKKSPQNERTLLDGVLIRLQPMPFDKSRARCSADGLGVGGFFKWSPYSNNLVVRNSVLMVDRLAVRCAGAMGLPPGTYENVTLVWLGQGDYPGSLPDKGVTVVRDRQAWDAAKADWLERHGNPS